LTVTEKQRTAIKSYVKQGYSANKIQVNLKNRHIGIRRKELLAEVRRVKGQPRKAETVKYIPKKYVKARWKARAELERILETKQVTITGKHTWVDKKGKKGKKRFLSLAKAREKTSTILLGMK
jgi:hypothetical protein